MSKYKCTIKIGNNMSKADNEKNMKNGKGCGSIVYINGNASNNLARNPKTFTVKRIQTPAYIILAHELIHALRYAQGCAISYSIVDENSYTYGTGTITEKVSREELIVVGISVVSNYDITENKIRAEHGIWSRVGYKSW